MFYTQLNFIEVALLFFLDNWYSLMHKFLIRTRVVFAFDLETGHEHYVADTTAQHSIAPCTA